MRSHVVPTIELNEVSKIVLDPLPGVISRSIERRVLIDITLRINPNDIIIIEGVIGSGKSTLLHLIAGIDRPNSGDIYVNGRSLRSMSQRDTNAYRNKICGFATQETSTIDTLSLLENMALPLLFNDEITKEERNQRYEAIIRRFDLQEIQNRYNVKLTPGQKRRLSIARALINDPLIILADEATENLDPQSERHIFLELQKEVKFGKTLIMVTHRNEWKSYFSPQYTRQFRVEAGKLLQVRPELQSDSAITFSAPSIVPKTMNLQEMENILRRCQMMMNKCQNNLNVLLETMQEDLNIVGDDLISIKKNIDNIHGVKKEEIVRMHILLSKRYDQMLSFYRQSQ